MKKLSVLRLCAGNFLGCILMTVVSFHSASAQEAPNNQILQNKADQQEVRLHTAAVVTQIQGLIDELAANGISGDDIKVLNATKAALTNLSGPEMDRVISSLQKGNAVNAYAGQKGIILQFRQILKDYEQRQAAYELPVRFKELSTRQTDTLLASVNVARATAGKSASELTGMQQTTQQIVQADQEAISNEVNLAVEQLNKAAQNSTEDDAKPMQQAQKDMKSGALQQALSQANDALKAGQLLKAIQAQQTARDELKKIAQDLNPPTNAVDALTATAASLAKLIAEQKSLLDQTNAAVDIKPPVTGLDEKQGALVDETNSLQQDMQSLSATNAGLVKDAIAPMQVSRAALTAPYGPGAKALAKAAASEQEAIAKLEAAQVQLQQQVADAQKAADDAAKDPVAKLQDLQKKIQEEMQQQQQIAKQTAQAANAAQPDPAAAAQAQQNQSQLQQQTAALQQAAQPLSLPASQALAKAADQMNQAANPPPNAANNPAAQQAAQQAAQDALAQANQAVGQQIAQAQQQAADPAALAAAATSLQKAQDSVSNALAATTPPPAAAPPAGAPPTMAQAAADLAAAAKQTDAAAATPGLPAAAAAAVADAKADIGKGQDAAAKGNAPDTAAAAAAAQGALAQAQASVAMAQAGMAGAGAPMAGGPPGSPEQGMPGPDMASMDGAKNISGGSTDKGTLHGAAGNGKFVTVASRDRAAIDQTQGEKRPQEYAPLIDQYMKNLADQSSSSP